MIMMPAIVSTVISSSQHGAATTRMMLTRQRQASGRDYLLREPREYRTVILDIEDQEDEVVAPKIKPEAITEDTTWVLILTFFLTLLAAIALVPHVLPYLL